MKRVEANGKWSLFCPNEAPGLHEVHGAEFEALYEKYEREGRARKTIDAQKLWYAAMEAQIETGGPFMLYKDAANGKDAEVARRSSTLTEMQPSLTSRTLEPSNHPISAPRSSSTHPRRRWLSATSPLSLSRALSTPSRGHTTSTSYTTLRRSSRSISTGS